ncbi:MAG: F0F1 ATP synthase subunit epsilon [Chloroflexi bacterium]|nr:F0F1 ATP synthase subunit epsilon [Chloroflexota bacterium]
MTLKLEILTAERQVYSGEVDIVIAPGELGELGILPRHASLLTPLQPGELRIRKGNEEITMTITGGFMEMFQDTLTVLADAAERAEEIDIERAQEAMRKAEERIRTTTTDMDLSRALASLRRSRLRIKVAERRRRRGAGPSI